MKSGIAKTIVKIVPATFKLETAMVNDKLNEERHCKDYCEDRSSDI